MPLKPGYSRATVSANIKKLRREGFGAARAVAAAMNAARTAFKRRHAGRALPETLKSNPKQRARSQEHGGLRQPYQRRSPQAFRAPASLGPRTSALRMVVAFKGLAERVYYWDGAALRAGEHARAVLFVTEGQAKNAADMVMRGLRARGVPLHVAVLPYMPAAEIKRALRAALRARNPVSASRRTALSKAATLYRDFTGMEPTHVQRVHVKPVKVGVKIGSLDALAYTTRREGKTERYAHEFSKQARPLLGVSDDGRSIVTAGGRFRFTDRGFVDRK